MRRWFTSPPPPPPPLPSAHASEAILYRCFTGCGVKTRWSRYSCHHQQQNQLYSSCGRLQAEQTGQSEKSLFTTYLFCLVIKRVALFTPIFCYVVILHLAWLWQTWEVNVISLLPFVLDSSSLCSIQGRPIRCHQPRLAKDVWSQRTTGDFVS